MGVNRRSSPLTTLLSFQEDASESEWVAFNVLKIRAQRLAYCPRNYYWGNKLGRDVS
jgi:hypothetical protein